MTTAPHPDASRLGFGCASLGSRIASAKGLAALHRAHEQGVVWFDLAPSYGDGLAETIFAEFARGRRHALRICTKVGIAPPAMSPLARTLKPMAQATVQRLPALKAMIARGRPPATRMPLTPELIATSVDASLRRLGTDFVDVLSLHDPALDDLQRDEILRALEQVKASGKARLIGIAGSVDAAWLALDNRLTIDHLQFADGPGETGFAGLVACHGTALKRLSLATHSVFSRPLLLALIRASRTNAGTLAPLLSAHGYGAIPVAEATIRAASLDFALQANPDGRVLVSMFDSEHLRHNLERTEHYRRHDAIALFRAIEQQLGPQMAGAA